MSSTQKSPLTKPKSASGPAFHLYLYAGKLMVGVHARPISKLEVWAKAGYLRVDDNLLIEDSAVGNLGIQYRFTPAWGVVGEAEFYEDVRFYRLGVRASF